jgi:peptide/nickel transport system substrate-binding protein
VPAPASGDQTGQAGQTVGEAGGELIVGLSGDIVAVDPAFAYDFTANPVICEITEGLLKFKDGATLAPNLATSWENPDPLTYIYHIRQGVTFQDGSPMTMDDVLFSLEASVTRKRPHIWAGCMPMWTKSSRRMPGQSR